MAKNKAISRETRRYILDQVFERGEMNVEEVVKIIDPLYEFDPVLAREREVATYARRVLASAKSADGVRSVLAVEGEPGLFINIDTCKNLNYVRKVTSQLDRKWEGLNKTRNKARLRRSELEGQTSLFDVKPAKESGMRHQPSF